VHITEKFFKTEGHMDFLHHICEVAAVKGNTYFVFDRGDTAKISECCRLSFKLEASDQEDAKEPWRMRYSALQNVTINLPRLAYRAKGDDTKLFTLLTEQIKLAAKAHEQKKNFIEKLMALGKGGPLALLAMDLDGNSYLRVERCIYLMGMVGLNELI
jgi:ribonucleoside-triphosphate reductase